MNTTDAGTSGGRNNDRDCPNRWLSGSRFRIRSGRNGRAYFLYLAISASTGFTFANRLPCAITTPFGSVVVPDVKTISAMSSPVSATGASGASSRAFSTSGSRQTGALLPSTAGTRSPTRITAGRTFSSMRRNSAMDDCGSTGARATPSSRQPHSAATHPGRLSDQITATSPLRTPCARSRTLNA